MLKGYKIRIHPTREQEEEFLKVIDTCRFIYNWTIEQQKNSYKEHNKFMMNGELNKIITQLKKEEKYNWLNNYSSYIITETISDCCDGFIRFFKKQNAFPKFKSKKKIRKLSFPVRGERLLYSNNTVNFEKIGRIKMYTNELDKAVKLYNCRCSFDGKYWYLSFSKQVDDNQVKKITDTNDLILGIDLGVKDLAILSNGIVFKNINKMDAMKKEIKKLKKQQANLNRKYTANACYDKTCNVQKTIRKIRKIYRRIKNIKLNHIHQITNKIIKMKPNKIVIEDLVVKDMIKNKALSRSIIEECFGEFRRQLEYKCKWNGIELVVADRYYPSSKTCSCCGHIKKDLKLSDRTYICEECGLVIDRDYNASINLANYSK